VRHIKQNFDLENLVVVSPDVGGLVRARAIASKIGSDLAIVDKRRPQAGVSEVMNIIGEVEGKNCIIVDDMVDSGGTLCNAAEALIKKGAISVSAYITHGVLSGKAGEKIANSKLKNLVITNSIEPSEITKATKNIKIINIADLIGEAIRNISLEKSVSTLFD
jgi:ribose-phosphate pyrophosphokinase